MNRVFWNTTNNPPSTQTNNETISTDRKYPLSAKFWESRGRGRKFSRINVFKRLSSDSRTWFTPINLIVRSDKKTYYHAPALSWSHDGWPITNGRRWPMIVFGRQTRIEKDRPIYIRKSDESIFVIPRRPPPSEKPFCIFKRSTLRKVYRSISWIYQNRPTIYGRFSAQQPVERPLEFDESIFVIPRRAYKQLKGHRMGFRIRRSIWIFEG
jgi:hypothetical protein